MTPPATSGPQGLRLKFNRWIGKSSTLMDSWAYGYVEFGTPPPPPFSLLLDLMVSPQLYPSYGFLANYPLKGAAIAD